MSQPMSHEHIEPLRAETVYYFFSCQSAFALEQAIFVPFLQNFAEKREVLHSWQVINNFDLRHKLPAELVFDGSPMS